MRKTLRNIVACSIIAGSLLFSNCNKEEKSRQAKEDIWGKENEIVKEIKKPKLIEDYFLNKKELEDVTIEVETEGLEPWMENEGIIQYEYKDYHFKLKNGWDSFQVILYTYSEDKDKKVYEYNFSPFKQYGFILDNNKFAYFLFSGSNHIPTTQTYLKIITSYQKRHNAKLYFGWEKQNIKISSEEYMRRLNNFLKNYAEITEWQTKTEEEHKEELLKD